MLAELIAHLITGIVRVGDMVMDVVGVLFDLDRKMKDGSRVGESPQEAESRRWWQRVEDRWFVIAMILLLTAAAVFAVAEWW